MSLHKIDRPELLGYSDLYRGFLFGNIPAVSYYPNQDISTVLAQLENHEFDREIITAILHEQNKHWQAPDSVHSSIDKLIDKRAACVFTGQQAMLFGGPYMILLKALVAIKTAREIESKHGVPAVPVFWISADDHDLEEISDAYLFDQQGELTELRIDVDADRHYPPVGALEFDTSIDRERQKLESRLPDNDFKAMVTEVLHQAYVSGENMVEAFAKFLLALLGRFGLVVFSPYDQGFKQAAGPFFERLINESQAVRKHLAKQGKKIAADGYHIQVQKSDTAAHLFMHLPERIAVHCNNNGFLANETSYSREQLREITRKEPFSFSTDVLTRPVLQSTVFPTAAIIGGPAEIAYFAQMMPLFEVFNTVPPKIIARPSVTIVENKVKKLLDTYDLNFEDIIPDIQPVITRLAADAFPGDLKKQLDVIGKTLQTELAKLEAPVGGIDDDLPRTLQQIAGKIDYQYNDLRQKIFAAFKRKNETMTSRLDRLYRTLYPQRSLAERTVATVYFLSRYGEGIIDHIFEHLPDGNDGHHLLELSDYHG